MCLVRPFAGAMPRPIYCSTRLMRRTRCRFAPLRRRLEFFAEYEQVILETAGVPVTANLARQVWALAIAVPKEFTPFADTMPALDALRKRGYRLGVITNLRADLVPLIRKAGLEDILEFAVNSTQAGVEKPHPPIFQEALRRAAVQPAEVLHVGDQVRSDVAGARAMGMKAALLDRGGWHEPVEDCPKISGTWRNHRLVGTGIGNSVCTVALSHRAGN